MKSLKFLLAGALLGVLLMYSGCGGGGDATPPPEDVQLGKLSKTWKTSAVTLDGTSQMASYQNFVLTISGTAGQTANGFNYSVTGRPSLSPWPANGTFKFGADVATQLVRDDGLPITYAVTETPAPGTLQITFNYGGNGIAGRVNQVQGNWVMTFTPQ
jgi:hypothetical protein